MKKPPTKRYHLKIMHPSRGTYDGHTKTVTVDANGYESSNGAYRFRDNGNSAIASYPVNFTIIEKIESLEND